MPLPSFIQRLRQRSSAPPADASPLSSADIEVARVRARRRLVGMVVLVGAGVIGLPWLFETQPRPLSTDVQVVSAVASHGNAAPAPSGPAPAIVAMTAPQAPVARMAPQPVQEDEAEATTASAPARAPASAPVPRPVAAVPASKPASKPTPAKAQAAQAQQAPKPAVAAGNAASKESARAKALLDGKPQAQANAKPAGKPASAAAPEAKSAAKPASDADTRYVVQIGAYSDVPAAHEVRMKAERLGIKTYTQVVVTPAGKKIRVRLGPYASKAEADKAMDALRKAGLTGAVLTL